MHEQGAAWKGRHVKERPHYLETITECDTTWNRNSLLPWLGYGCYHQYHSELKLYLQKDMRWVWFNSDQASLFPMNSKPLKEDEGKKQWDDHHIVNTIVNSLIGWEKNALPFLVIFKGSNNRIIIFRTHRPLYCSLGLQG